jgi:hypothetical protein
MLTDREMKPLYDKVMAFLLNQRPYGEFFAIRELFGEDMAKMVAKRGDIIPPPGGLVDRRAAIPGKNRDDMDMDMDIDHDQRNIIELSDN